VLVIVLKVLLDRPPLLEDNPVRFWSAIVEQLDQAYAKVGPAASKVRSAETRRVESVAYMSIARYL
jgi:hypothetical protein